MFEEAIQGFSFLTGALESAAQNLTAEAATFYDKVHHMRSSR